MSNELQWRDGVPWSARFEDVYFDRRDGAAESEFVFLDGCDLPARWASHPRSSFVIGETGFGTGLNFLVTLDAWIRHRRSGQRLFFLTTEAYPLSRVDLQRAVEPFQLLASLARKLVDVYPEFPAPGRHRLHLDCIGVTLDLLVGDAEDSLKNTVAGVDAWFLDGFAPARNPSMWNDGVYHQLARLSRPGCRLGTFTAAGEVRRGLTRAGFDVRKTTGFGHKRERLVATFNRSGRQSADHSGFPDWANWATASCTPDHVEIAGDGIAGASLAVAANRRDMNVSIRGDGRARASDVPAAMVMPRLGSERDIASRLFADSFRYAGNHYRQLEIWEATGAIELGGRKVGKEEAIGDTWSDLATVLDAGAIRDRTGIDAQRALEYPAAGRVRWQASAAPIGGAATKATAMIKAGGAPGAAELEPWLPFQFLAGEMTRIDQPVESSIPVSGVCSIVADSDEAWIGSTFVRLDRAEEYSAANQLLEEQDNLARYAKLTGIEAQPIGHWRGLRAMLPDRLPAAGPMLDRQAFSEHYRKRHQTRRIPPHDLAALQWTLTGLGARGFTLAPLLAELVLSQLNDDPWPVALDCGLAVHPMRFLWRRLKRAEFS